MHPFVLSLSASRSLLPSPQNNTTPYFFALFRGTLMGAVKVGEEVNDLSEVMSPQILSPHPVVGRYQRLPGLLNNTIPSVPVPSHIEDKSIAVFMVPPYFFTL